MGGINRHLRPEHQLPDRSSDVANAVIANYIAEAQQYGDAVQEYVGWAVYDHLADVSMASTNSDRAIAGLDRINRVSRIEYSERGQEFAHSVHDYGINAEQDIADAEELLDAQNIDIQNRIRALAQAKKVSVDSAIGLMLYFEVAKPAEGTDIMKVNVRVDLARKAVSARLFNITAKTTLQTLLEELIQTRNERGRYVMPSEYVRVYTRLHPPKAYEPEQLSFLRLRSDMIRGLEELFDSSNNV